MKPDDDYQFWLNYGFRFAEKSKVKLVIFVLALPSIWYSLVMRNLYHRIWTIHLLFPEETIAELTALKRRRQKQNFPQWKLNLELATEVILLLWAVHIQIRFQNLSLPPSKKRNIE